MMIWAALAAAQPAAAACVERTLDYAGWRAAPGQQWDYRWRGEGAALTMIGAEHSADPSHPQFARIERELAEAAPTLIFYEGRGPDPGAGTAEDIIRRQGEPAFLRLLAAKANIPTQSLEPDPVAQLRALLADEPVDQVLLFLVLRQTASMRERSGMTGDALDQGVSRLLERSALLAQLQGLTLPFSDLAGLTAAAARYWPQRDWRTIPLRWFSPLADDARTGGVFLARINRADSRNRDRHMARQVIAAVKRGERVFVLVGRNHVPMQAPALDCALRA